MGVGERPRAGLSRLEHPVTLRAELAESPAVVERLLVGARAPLRELAAHVVRRRIDAVILAARGTSDHAATYAQYVLGIGFAAYASAQ